jgi:hypothetical protein
VVYLDGFGENPPGRRILEGTDLEIAYRLEGDDLVVQVNKGPVQVCRVRLKDARKPMSDAELTAFNGVARRILHSGSARTGSVCGGWRKGWGWTRRSWRS